MEKQQGHNPRNYDRKNIARMIKALSDLYDITPINFLVAYDEALVVHGQGTARKDLCIYLTQTAWESLSSHHDIRYDYLKQHVYLPGNIKLRPIELCDHQFEFKWVHGVMTADFYSLYTAFKDLKGKSNYDSVNERNLQNLILVETILNVQRQRADVDLRENVGQVLSQLTTLVQMDALAEVHTAAKQLKDDVTGTWKDPAHKKWIYRISPTENVINLEYEPTGERYRFTLEKYL